MKQDTARRSPRANAPRVTAHRLRTLIGSLVSLSGLATLVAWRTAPAARETAITVMGTVHENGSARALDGTQLTLTPIGGAPVSATSAADGRYRVTVRVARLGATMELVARRAGYEPTRLTVVAKNDAVRVNVTLTMSAVRVMEAPLVSNKAMRATVGAATSIAAASPPAYPYANMPRSEPRRRDERVRDTRMTDAQVRQGAGGADSTAAVRSPNWNREQYDRIVDNPFLGVKGNPRSTFSVDVDRASYGNVRRFLTQGQLPPADAVRVEELVNYFPYHLESPRGDAPVAITTEVTPAPWQRQHQLVRIALQARRINTAQLPPSNLVFLIDVSGSMFSPDKLPLVKSSLRLLVEQLRPQDRVALVVYAGSAGVVLPSTDGTDKARIMEAIDRLEAGGSTAGGAGLALAYKVAREHFERGGNNRVILATDGDFNVGASSDAEMERLIESKRDEGTYLTVLGFGTGNYQDAKMKKMAKIGNGNYAYVDQLDEARKVLVHEMGATLLTVANDVKLQIEFNPKRVASYRLIGYEDRLLRDEDFTDDKKDAGDMGAGHTVTALYEVVPVGVRGTITVRESDPLRYTPDASFAKETDARQSGDDELLYVKLRYKTPGESSSKLLAKAVRTRDARERASDDMRFASAVASFGMLLRGSEYKGDASANSVLTLARDAGDDDDGYRSEFIRLVQRWQELSRGIAERPHPGIR